ncbi:MAG: transketolase family protein, partial [Spirochaetales bacterium]|nr:transketolase family protein [Spirochaetales bacterium]
VELHGPVYMRFTRDPIPYIYDKQIELEIGKANLINDGHDVAIIASGDIMDFAVKAVNALHKQGISARLLDMHTIKPLDIEAVIAAVDDCEKIITLEDHNIINGLGSAVSEVIAEYGKGKLKRMGVQDRFGESGPYKELLAVNGVTVDKIAETAKRLIQS